MHHVPGKQGTTCFRNQGLRVSPGSWFSGCLLNRLSCHNGHKGHWSSQTQGLSFGDRMKGKWMTPSSLEADSSGLQWGSLGLALILCLSPNQETWATLAQLGFHANSFNDEWGQTYLIHLVQSVHRSVDYVTSRRGKDWWPEEGKRVTRAKVWRRR